MNTPRRVWRISAHPGLSGIGGHHVNGRWHSAPRSILYTAEHPALAMVEAMAQMRLSMSNIPTTLKLIAIEIAADARIAPSPDLPHGWQANEPTSQALGNAWLDARDALALPVPSALLAHATNYLLNPQHRQAATHLREVAIDPFWFDQRYLR